MARSPVFQAMLGSDMVEKSRGMIKIEVRRTNIEIYTNTITYSPSNTYEICSGRRYGGCETDGPLHVHCQGEQWKYVNTFFFYLIIRLVITLYTNRWTMTLHGSKSCLFWPINTRSESSCRCFWCSYFIIHTITLFSLNYASIPQNTHTQHKNLFGYLRRNRPCRRKKSQHKHRKIIQ